MKESKVKQTSAIGIMTAAMLTLGITSHASDCGTKSQATKTETSQTISAKTDAKNVVETAMSAGNFNTLVTAVKAAGLDGVLSGDGPFTVFAPTDEAFARLLKGTVEGLLKDKDALIAVLTYHVVSGKVMAGDVVKINEAKTVNGQALTVKSSDKGVFIDNASVTTPDIVCSNGVIHVIDAVLLPPNDQNKN